MAKNQYQHTFSFARVVKKFFLSSFVVLTFIVYVVQQRFTKPDSALSPTPANSGIVAPLTSSSNGAAPTSSAEPTLAIQPSATPRGAYKDGVYTGPQVDAYYGIVEVQATIQNGKIADVQFLQYPNDRRTSQRINSIAMPYLQQEALQAQSANVNIISGATFTSEGFVMSLNSALDTARN